MIYNTTRCFEFKPLIILKLVNIEYSLFKYFCRFSFFMVNFNCISLFGLARILSIFRKEEGRLSLKYSCINVRTLSLYVSSRLRTFSFVNNGFEFALKVLLLTAQIAFFAKIWYYINYAHKTNYYKGALL